MKLGRLGVVLFMETRYRCLRFVQMRQGHKPSRNNIHRLP